MPVSIGLNYFPAKFTGTTTWAAYYDFPNWKQAYIKAAQYCEPDRLLVVPNQSGNVLEALDATQLRWPGHGVSRYHTHQFVEGEYMKEDEYDLLLNDTSDFLVRRYLPRVYGILAPTGKLPPLNTLITMLPFNNLADPEFVAMLENLTPDRQRSGPMADGNVVAGARTHRDGLFLPQRSVYGQRAV